MRIETQTIFGKVKYIVATANKIIKICDTYEQAQETKIAFSIV